MKKLMLMLVIVVTVSVGTSGASLADIRPLITNKACNVIVNSNPGVVQQPVNDNVPGCSTSDPGVASKGGLADELLTTFMFVAGIISFLFIVIGGIRYIASDGDATRIAAAKQTLLYAIIGLIVTLIAATISGFVIRQVAG